ncbi:hypothetical protein CR164_08305 [Prosthecochloris marina]|uniref:Uncharacterized protein n=1 Tax=Prosthecochloris marina TaxID=2017681 RepID=A0A317T586_9CHLB|nr:hypothetical protein CR164_08305 [Prosthecochloris marina]
MLLDVVGNSMNGLIEQTESPLWRMVGELFRVYEHGGDDIWFGLLFMKYCSDVSLFCEIFFLF